MHDLRSKPEATTRPPSNAVAMIVPADTDRPGVEALIATQLATAASESCAASDGEKSDSLVFERWKATVLFTNTFPTWRGLVRSRLHQASSPGGSSPCRQVGGRLSKSHANDYDYQKRDPDDGDDGIGGTPGGPTRDFGGRRFPVVGGKFITLVDHYWACLPIGLQYHLSRTDRTLCRQKRPGVGCLFKRAFVCHGCRIACRPGHVR
jgi:hypothetical protein